MLVMFTSDPYLTYNGELILGFTRIGHNVIVINLYGIHLLNSWNHLGFIVGYWSIVMHEAGHCYGCMGDTYGVHLDVMDYHYGRYYPYSSQFDEYHQGIICPRRGLHSD